MTDRKIAFTPEMGAELEWFFAHRASAMGERSGHGAFVDTCMSGINKGGIVGDHGAMISRLGSVDKERRIRAALGKLDKHTQDILAARYSVASLGARAAADRVPGLRYPGIALVVKGKDGLNDIHDRLHKRAPDKASAGEKDAAEQVRREARKAVESLNKACLTAEAGAHACYAVARAIAFRELPRRERAPAKEEVAEMREDLGAPPKRIREELLPVFKAGAA